MSQTLFYEIAASANGNRIPSLCKTLEITPSTPTERHLIGVGSSGDLEEVVQAAGAAGKHPLFDACEVMSLPLSSGNSDILVLEDEGIILVADIALNSIVNRSTNWGATFSQISLPSMGINAGAIFLTASGSILVYKQSGPYVCRSTDNGATFSTQVSVSGLGRINKIVQREDGRLLAYQTGASAYGYSDDDGVSWTFEESSMVGGPVGNICASSVGPRFVSVAASGVAKHSTDGVTWTSVSMPSYLSVSNPTDADGTLFCLDPGSSGWAKSVDGGLTWSAGGNTLKSAGGTFTEWVPICNLSLGFNQYATGTDSVMSKSYGLNGWTDQYWPVTQDPIMRVIASPSQNCLFVLSSKLLFRVPLVDG